MPVMFNPYYIGPNPPCCDTDCTEGGNCPIPECGPCPGPCGGGCSSKPAELPPAPVCPPPAPLGQSSACPPQTPAAESAQPSGAQRPGC
ncbi:uncharacterized protein Dwil_GK28230 [Drosophila willistoni]|uniref:Uncharacterized protein n=1 Tax=Drosophila willistoni TaxID=7260 RepID=A0A0Q9WYH2_DROWI|nr:male-specific sperm protein Mst84Dd [Drosophila willistoni]KRF98622.1 uncharacterized protein Dwil_GK28230 [Drosophila willistoni]